MSNNINNNIAQIIFPKDVEIRKVRKRPKKKKNNRKKKAIEALKEALQQFDMAVDEAQQHNIQIPQALGHLPSNVDQLNTIKEIEALTQNILSRYSQIQQLVANGVKSARMNDLFGEVGSETIPTPVAGAMAQPVEQQMELQRAIAPLSQELTPPQVLTPIIKNQSSSQTSVAERELDRIESEVQAKVKEEGKEGDLENIQSLNLYSPPRGSRGRQKILPNVLARIKTRLNEIAKLPKVNTDNEYRQLQSDFIEMSQALELFSKPDLRNANPSQQEDLQNTIELFNQISGRFNQVNLDRQQPVSPVALNPPISPVTPIRSPNPRSNTSSVSLDSADQVPEVLRTPNPLFSGEDSSSEYVPSSGSSSDEVIPIISPSPRSQSPPPIPLNQVSRRPMSSQEWTEKYRNSAAAKKQIDKLKLYAAGDRNIVMNQQFKNALVRDLDFKAGEFSRLDNLPVDQKREIVSQWLEDMFPGRRAPLLLRNKRPGEGPNGKTEIQPRTVQEYNSIVAYLRDPDNIDFVQDINKWNVKEPTVALRSESMEPNNLGDVRANTGSSLVDRLFSLFGP